MGSRRKPGRRQHAGEFLNRFAIPGVPAKVLLIPGFEKGPRQDLAFILKALDGKHVETVADHLAKFFVHDLNFRPVEGSQQLKALINHDQELFYRAVDCFIETIRRMTDMWIESGKKPTDLEVDTPSDRNVEDVQPGHEISLFVWIDRLLFDRHPQFTGMRRNGSIGVKGAFPHLDHITNWLAGPEAVLEDYGRMWAAWHFSRLLDSPHSRKIARCDYCGRYFAYERARLRTVKYGVFCPQHSGKAAVRRTVASRTKRLKTAARAWIEWESKRKGRPEFQWIADQVNKSHNTAFRRRWVSQHLKEIQKYVEAGKKEARNGTQKAR